MHKKTQMQGKPVRKKEDSWLNKDVKASTGLPPQVYGQVRCFCKLSVSQVVWTIPKPPNLALVRVKWWGEEGDGVLFRPVDVKKGSKGESQTTARYPVRSGPCQFATYLSDMGNLTLDLMTGSHSQVIGQATVSQIGLLTNSRPINGFFPVVSASGQKLANLQVSVVLEPLVASYDNLGTIPTTDISMENGRGYDSMAVSVNSHPLPYSDLPTRPDNTVFISPSSVNDGHRSPAVLSKTYFDNGLRQQLNYGLPDASAINSHQHHPDTGAVAITTNGDVVSLPESRAIGSAGGLMVSGAINSNISGSRGLKSPTRTTGSVNKDLLSVLVEKGTKLREAMIVSSMHADVNTHHSNNAARTRSDNNINSTLATQVNGSDDVALTNVYAGSSKYALLASPVRNQDFQLYNLMNGLSPGSSMSSDIGYDQVMSDLEDPMHEHSIIHELFYHHSDNEGQGFSDVTGYANGHQHHYRSADNHYMSLPARLPGGSGGENTLETAGNQRPPSRTSSLTSLNMIEPNEDEDGVGKKKKSKRRARSRSRSSSRSGSQTRSRSNTTRRSELKVLKPCTKAINLDMSKDSKSMKSKKNVRSRSSSRSRSRSRSRRRKLSDSDRLSTAWSENSKDVNRLKQDGLSVERLTLLGRVHVARVNIDSLQLLRADLLDTSDTKLYVSKFKTGKPPRPQRSKKLCTYFVEYQFPVVAASRDKYIPNAIATEVTRIASKSIKSGAVIFSHRCVFPVLFDGAAVERWWKSALVFRLYCREAGQQTPVLVGSGGISLKSVLRSESLFVQREIEIVDTSKNGSHNNSHTSSLNSSASGRSGVTVFGSLKASVELASDHKEFPTIMARTKLAEMSGNVKIIPIDGVPPDQARLLEQLKKNKDEPLIRSPTKKIDILGTTSQALTSSPVTGLPPQSPRRKAAESTGDAVIDDDDEISKLKQQLKATLAALNNPDSQKQQKHHLDSGANISREQREIEPTTLHTLLYLQEGRNITLHGVPPLHMVNKYPGLLQAQQEPTGRDSVTRNTYLVCRMFWTNDEVHSDVCWGTLNPEFNFLQIAPVLMTSTLLERMRDNYMIVEVWDKKVSSENNKLIGMVKLSLHQLYLSFRERKIANALLKSEYPVIAIDNYMPIVDPFSGLHFGQLKVVLAMGSEPQIINLQRLALGSEVIPLKPSSYLERQDLQKDGGSIAVSGKSVEHQFEIVVESLRGLKLFENMIWGEADCFIQFFFPAEGERADNDIVTVKSIPTMKCFRTVTTLCIPDPTFHDTFRHKLTLPLGVPVQRELLTACANSGGSVTGLPFEVWCRYYHPNVRDQLIAKCTLPLAKLCAMVTMHKSAEACVQSFSLRLSQVGVEGHEQDAEATAKCKDAGVLGVTVNYKCQQAVGKNLHGIQEVANKEFLFQSESTLMAANRSQAGSHVCLSLGIIRATGLKAAADSIARLDSSMAYPADVGVNAYVRINISFLGKENERVTKTVARSFAPEFAHWMDFPCPLLVPQGMTSDSTSLAELLESSEVVFEVWHQMPTGLNKDFYVEKSKSGLSTRKLAHQVGDTLLGTAVVPLASLLTRRTGLSGWFPINLPSLGWTKPVHDDDILGSTSIDQAVGGLELSIRFAHQEDRDRVVSVARSVGWSPADVAVEQPDWQDEDSHHNVHNVTVCVEQVSFPHASALTVGQPDLDPLTRCYVRYNLYDKGAVVSKSRKLQASDGGLVCSLDHKHSFMLSHTAPLQWYLREERLEVQAWVTYGCGREGEEKPRQRDKLIGSCYVDLESLTDMRRRQQRISGLFPMFKPGTSNLRTSFIKAQIVSRVCSSAKDQTSANEMAVSESEVSVSASETEQSRDGFDQSLGDMRINKSPKKRKSDGYNPVVSFGVVLAVERAMHLPMVRERNRSGEISPTTYVSFQSAERSKPTCSSVFPNSVNPMWDYVVETRLSTEFLYKENKNLVLKVWHKPSEAPKTPDKSSDRVLGFVSVDLSSLTKGLHQICGWYNIMDFNGQCRGQIKVSITPTDMQSVVPSTSSGSSFMLPSFATYASTSENTRAVASSIAEQLVSLQQQVLLRMGALSRQTDTAGARDMDSTAQEVDSRKHLAVKDPVSDSVSTATTTHWKPVFAPQIRTDDPSKSYLFSSLRRQLQDLDTITQRLKHRLATPTQKEDARQDQINNSPSQDILIGTQSDLSTIHTASMLLNTREISEPSPYAFSFEVGTSQESTRSRMMNNSSGVDNDADSVRMQNDTDGSHGHRLTDSGVFSARNLSEKSGEVVLGSHSVGTNLEAVTPSGVNLSALSHGGVLSHGVASVGTMEARFLALAETNPQTLYSALENCDGSGNSRGFVPQSQRSNMTESFVREWGHRKSGSIDKDSSNVRGAENGSQHAHVDSLSARSDEKTVDEKVDDYISDNEEGDEGHRGGTYGSYHRYREMLDAEEVERNGSDEEEDNVADEVEVVEIVPRSLNNISTVLALGASVEQNSAKATYENFLRPAQAENSGYEVDHLTFSPASPNANILEGTSVWCSEDNDDSFFQHVFERNQGLILQTGKNMDEVTLDSWLLEHSDDASKARLENWLEIHRIDKARRPTVDGTQSDVYVTGNVVDDQESMSKHRNGGRVYHSINDHEDKDVRTEEVAPMEERISETAEEDTGHDSEDTLRDGERNVVWNQNTENSSDEETSRNLSSEKQSLSEHCLNQEHEVTTKIKDFHLRDIEEEFDKETDVPSHGSTSLLSNVEFLDSGTYLPDIGKTSHSTHNSLSTSSFVQENLIQLSSTHVSTLPLNHTTNGNYPSRPELAYVRPHHQYRAQGARPKTSNLLSNVDLDSNSSSRPFSGTSHESKTSPHSHNSMGAKGSQKSRTSSLNSGDNFDKVSKMSERNVLSDKSGQKDSVMLAGSSNKFPEKDSPMSNNQQEIDDSPNNRDNSNVIIQAPSVPRPGRDRNSTLNSAYLDGDCNTTHPSSLGMINGVHTSTEDITPEDSVLNDRDGINGHHTIEKSDTTLPNFFMSERDMQASIKALQMATTAANLNKDKFRAQNKVKAVSELVSKMASSKVKASALSIKNKNLPSAEEAQRIAKIFSSKMS